MTKWLWVWPTLAVAVLAGCASKGRTQKEPQPGSGIAEYTEITESSIRAITGVLKSLETVGSQSNAMSPEALKTFSTGVQRLQVDSLQVRARSQAVLTRGDSYFERWHENMAKVNDLEMRALAEKRRPMLQKSFERIKELSAESREIFNPFLTGLRELRNGLEADPGRLKMPEGQRLLAKLEADGKQLLQHLSGIRGELASMKEMVTPESKGQP